MLFDAPRVRQFVAPTDAERAASVESAAQFRAKMTAARDAERPARRAAIVTGPDVRDIEAAVDCHCSCHPRPAASGLHDGGVTCNCQRTEEERREWWTAWQRDLDEYHETDEYRRERQRADEANERFEAAAARLGVDASVQVSMAPFVITGVCDGRGFYLRERNGQWRVTISPADEPLGDPWTMDPSRATVDIAEGSESAFEVEPDHRRSDERALEIAVRSVRAALRRANCDHARDGHDSAALMEDCGTCGVRLDRADVWRAVIAAP